MNDLTLAAEHHKYRLPSGVVAPSVTEILGILDWDNKSERMAYKAAKLTSEGVNYAVEWARIRDAGTRTHDTLETWMRGVAAEILPEDEPLVDQLEKWLFRQKNFHPLYIEQMVLSELGFGGRFDLIVGWDGVVTLVDLKTGKKHPLEHAMQLAAYAHSDGIGMFQNGNLVGLDPLPNIQRAGCLYVTEKSCRFVEYPIDDDVFAAFRSLLTAHQQVGALDQRLGGKA